MNEVDEHFGGIALKEKQDAETAALLARAKAHVDTIVDQLFSLLPPSENESDSIRSSLHSDLLLDVVVLSDEETETAIPATQEAIERFWFLTWYSYADPLSDGIDAAKGRYLCALAREIHTDEEMAQIPAAIAGLMYKPVHTIERTEIDGTTGEVGRPTSYASLLDVVTEYEDLYAKRPPSSQLSPAPSYTE